MKCQGVDRGTIQVYTNPRTRDLNVEQEDDLYTQCSEHNKIYLHRKTGSDITCYGRVSMCCSIDGTSQIASIRKIYLIQSRYNYVTVSRQSRRGPMKWSNSL